MHCGKLKGRGIDESLETHLSTGVLGGREGYRQAKYTKNHTYTNVPNVTQKIQAELTNHLILDKSNCSIYRCMSKIIMF